MSDPFEIKGLHLEFKKSPAETAVGAGLKYVLALEDPENKVITSDSTDGIGFFLNTVEGGTNATLTNTSDLLTRGVASNAETPPVTINSPGTYTITAKEILDTGGFSTTTESATSKEFVVAANKLVFTKQPGPKTFVDTRLNYVVELRNYKNQIVTTSSDQLQFTLNPVEGGAGAVLASNVDSLLAGIADDSNTSAPPLAINLPGTFTLSVIDVPPSPSDIAAKGALSKEFKVLPPIK